MILEFRNRKTKQIHRVGIGDDPIEAVHPNAPMDDPARIAAMKYAAAMNNDCDNWFMQGSFSPVSR